MHRYRCTVCGHIYTPAEGDPGGGVEQERLFESLLDDWFCPECGATKADYEQMDE